MEAINEDQIKVFNTTLTNSTSSTTVIDYPKFDKRALLSVIAYSCLFAVAGIGNVTVFVNLFRSRRRKSRISFLIIHLTVADLIVTFIMIPFEIAWRLSVQWFGGNIACKILVFFRAFGLYLSSNVLICISLDRYLAIVYPLMVTNKQSRGKWMLYCAWLASTIYALPQLVIFHEGTHPNFENFTQCVAFDYLSPRQEFFYNIICLTMMYFLPLLIIVTTYSSILWKMWKKAKNSKADMIAARRGVHHTSPGRKQSSNIKVSNVNETTFSHDRQVRTHPDHVVLRRSDMKCIERARIRTLKMTTVIVIVFIVCWTPYVVMTLWYMFDRDGAKKLPMWLQESMFMMAVSNSCMNPLVYGRYTVRTIHGNASSGQNTLKWKLFRRCCFPFTSTSSKRINIEMNPAIVTNKRRHYVKRPLEPIVNFLHVAENEIDVGDENEIIRRVNNPIANTTNASLDNKRVHIADGAMNEVLSKKRTDNVRILNENKVNTSPTENFLKTLTKKLRPEKSSTTTETNSENSKNTPGNVIKSESNKSIKCVTFNDNLKTI